jgi:hypothetical protein
LSNNISSRRCRIVVVIKRLLAKTVAAMHHASAATLVARQLIRRLLFAGSVALHADHASLLF